MPAEKKTKRPRKSTKQAQSPVEVKPEEVDIPDVSEVLQEPVSESVVESREEKTLEEEAIRVPPPPSSSRAIIASREELEVAFDLLVERLDREIESKKEDKKHSINLKTLRSITSDVKKLRKGSMKLARKTKQKSTTDIQNQGGFLKPVKVSKGLCKFAGWSPEELRSRVEVTQYICNYIKEHNLQNPNNRREIIPDKKLSKLLSYDSKSEDQPLTYWYLQKKMKDHYL